MNAPLVQQPAPPANLLVRRAQLLDPRTKLDGPGDVLVRDGRVAELGEPGALDAPAGVEVVEARGRLLTTAFVDPHVHLRTPGEEHKEDLDSGTRAAAAGGFCIVIAMPNTSPPIDAPPLLGAVRDAARREARVPVGFLAAASRGLGSEQMTEMATLREAGALGFTDDGLPLASARMVRRALQYQRLCGGVLALHEEDTTLSGDGVMHEGAVSAQLGMAGIPSISESVAIARDAAIAGYEDGRIHSLHVSCRESVEAVATAKEAGVRITAEACPHHLTHTDESVRTLATHYKMNPPLRSADDREALVDGLRSGVIDCVATDHAPHAPEEKDVPWEQALNGTTGLETAFAALHTNLVVPGRVSLALLVERMTAGAEVYDLPVPAIARDEPANLCLVDLDAEVTIGDEPYETRGEHCTYHGDRVQGRVLLTVAGGSVAYRQRAFALTAA